MISTMINIMLFIAGAALVIYALDVNAEDESNAKK